MKNETKVMSVRDAIIMAMSEEMRRDENVFLMGEDVEARREFIQQNAKDIRFLDI